jgi:hypothetical protein
MMGGGLEGNAQAETAAVAVACAGARIGPMEQTRIGSLD